MGALGHTVDSCKALKHKFQDLIDYKAFTFTPTGQNVGTNPMLAHVGSLVNAIKEVDNQDVIGRVEKIWTPIFIIGEQLRKNGLIPTNHVDNEACTSNTKNDENLKKCVQKLIYQGTIQIGRLIKKEEELNVLEIPYPVSEVQIPVTPLVTQVPASFPYESTEANPWVYELKTYKEGREIQPQIISEPNLT